jgi:hypothetical protein
VWILARDGRPAATSVTLGITDGVSTEITGGDLRAGDTVLIGLESDAVAVPSAGAVRIPRL